MTFNLFDVVCATFAWVAAAIAFGTTWAFKARIENLEADMRKIQDKLCDEACARLEVARRIVTEKGPLR